MNEPSPKSDGEPLAATTRVFRIGMRSELSPQAIRAGTASPVMFSLSTIDRRSPMRSVSIWVEALTLPDQAWTILGEKPKRNCVACSEANLIHEAGISLGHTVASAVWERALVKDEHGSWIQDTRPGTAGHAGIVGLDDENGLTSNQRKDLREAIASVFRLSPTPVPHGLPDETFREAAYFIHEKTGQGSEECWIQAVRQIRRAKVRECEAKEASAGDQPATAALDAP